MTPDDMLLAVRQVEDALLLLPCTAAVASPALVVQLGTDAHCPVCAAYRLSQDLRDALKAVVATVDGEPPPPTPLFHTEH